MAIVRMKKNKKSEYITKTSELRYRRLFETAQDGILLVDFDTGMILDVNNFLINIWKSISYELFNYFLFMHYKRLIIYFIIFFSSNSTDFLKYL